MIFKQSFFLSTAFLCLFLAAPTHSANLKKITLNPQAFEALKEENAWKEKVQKHIHLCNDLPQEYQHIANKIGSFSYKKTRNKASLVEEILKPNFEQTISCFGEVEEVYDRQNLINTFDQFHHALYREPLFTKAEIATHDALKNLMHFPNIPHKLVYNEIMSAKDSRFSTKNRLFFCINYNNAAPTISLQYNDEAFQVMAAYYACVTQNADFSEKIMVLRQHFLMFIQEFNAANGDNAREVYKNNVDFLNYFFTKVINYLCIPPEDQKTFHVKNLMDHVKAHVENIYFEEKEKRIQKVYHSFNTKTVLALSKMCSTVFKATFDTQLYEAQETLFEKLNQQAFIPSLVKYFLNSARDYRNPRYLFLEEINSYGQFTPLELLMDYFNNIGVDNFFTEKEILFYEAQKELVTHLEPYIPPKQLSFLKKLVQHHTHKTKQIKFVPLSLWDQPHDHERKFHAHAFKPLTFDGSNNHAENFVETFQKQSEQEAIFRFAITIAPDVYTHLGSIKSDIKE